jgi:hypothetical protein
MKTFVVVFLTTALAESAFCQTQTAVEPKEVSQLREKLETQEKQLQSQQTQLQSQHQEIEELKALVRGMQGHANPQLALGTPSFPPTGNETVADTSALTIHGLGSKADASVGTLGGAQQAAAPGQPQQAAPSGQQPVGAGTVQYPEKFNPTQEVAGEKPEGQAVEAGPVKLRFGGYLGLTGLYRSTNSGNGTGTSFNSTPLKRRDKATSPKPA